MSASQVQKAGSVNSQALSPCPGNKKQPGEQPGRGAEPREGAGNTDHTGRNSEVSSLRRGRVCKTGIFVVFVLF